MEELVRMYQLTNDKKILEKIIKGLDDIVNYFLKNNKLNLPKEEVYDYIIEGIITASKSYMFYGVSFKSYANLCVGRVFLRLNSKFFNENKLYENFLDMLSMMEKKYKKTLSTNPELLDITLEEMDANGLLYPYNYDDARKIISQMLRTCYIDFNTKNLTDDIRKMEEDIDSDYLKRIIKSTLTKAEYDYITSYYGLFNKSSETLEEIGKRYNISGEAVRQTKENALKKLGYILNLYNSLETNYFNIDKVIEFLEGFLSYQEITYLCHTFGIFTYSKKTYQELGNLYHESPETIEIKVGMILEKITFLINHLNIWSKVEFNNLYQLLESKFNPAEFKILRHYYGLFDTSKKSILEISELYSVDTNCINKIVKIIKSKLKELFNNPLVNNFLKNILNTEEYESLCIINNPVLGKKYFKSKTIDNIIDMVITKINILYKYQDLNINKDSLREYLKNILSETEFKNISTRYGLFNTTRTRLPIDNLYKISINDKKILEIIAISLNIENNKDKSI